MSDSGPHEAEFPTMDGNPPREDDWWLLDDWRLFPVRHYKPHRAPLDPTPFTQSELNLLAVMLGRSIAKTSIEGRTVHDIHGEIYTRLRQELQSIVADPKLKLDYNIDEHSKISGIFCRRFKLLPNRLSETQRRQLMTLFNELTRGSYSRYARNQVFESEQTEMEQIQTLGALASKASEEAIQQAKIAENISQQVKELEKFLDEGDEDAEAK
jgi:hypothetical protein